MSEFFGPSPWPALTERLSVEKRKVDAAIAFVTEDLLGLRSGDSLFVDASDARLRTGATNPAVLGDMLGRGATLWNVPGLHAKFVLVDSSWLMVGSANASKMSQKLHEASLVTRSRRAIVGAQQMLAQLQGIADPIDARFLAHARKVYRPPANVRGPRAIPLRGPVYWLVQSDPATEPNPAADKAAKRHQNRVRRRGSYATWTEHSDQCLRRVERGDFIVFAFNDGDWMLLEPEVVLGVEPLRGMTRLHTEERPDYETRSLPWSAGKALLRQLGETNPTLKKSMRLRKLTGERLVDWARVTRPYR